MILSKSTILLFGFLMCIQTLGMCSEAVLAGAAKNTITPELAGHAVYLAGFGHGRLATGVHDPLYVRCLALRISGNDLVLCSVDLIGLFYDDVQEIRRSFQKQAPPGAHLVIACTHTHEGPDTLGLWGPTATESGLDEKYLGWVEERVSTTAVEALRTMQPARIQLARDDHPLLAQLQSVDRPPYIKDPFLFVMRVTGASNRKTIATLVNWSDHPEILNRKNSEITADYPHWICQYLEEHKGGTALFFSGAIGKVTALGAQVALLDPQTGRVAEDGTWRKAELLGTIIGQLAERALENAKAISPDALTFRSSVIFIPLSNDRFRVAEAAGILLGRKPLFTDRRPDASTGDLTIDANHSARYALGHDLQSEVDYITLNVHDRPIAEIVTIPGEAFPEAVNGGITRYPGADYPDAPLETPLRMTLRTKYQFVLGLANDELGYLIPKAEWDEHPPWLQNNPQPYYGEINSVSPEAVGVVLRALEVLVGQN
jgi:hypothetical protein